MKTPQTLEKTNTYTAAQPQTKRMEPESAGKTENELRPWSKIAARRKEVAGQCRVKVGENTDNQGHATLGSAATEEEDPGKTLRYRKRCGATEEEDPGKKCRGHIH